jgi:hypothetical protein
MTALVETAENNTMDGIDFGRFLNFGANYLYADKIF